MRAEAVGTRELLGGEYSARRLLRPSLVTIVSFALGAALLGLAGWFIASCAVAGLAVSTTFSFLFPSAGVQALAWARTLGRYSERVTTHEATLNLVGALRTNLFARAVELPPGRAAQLRGSDLLGRITVDSDAVENLLLRSWFPTLAAVAAVIAAAAVFALLSWILALIAVAGLALTGGLLIALSRRETGRSAQRLVANRAAARTELIETLDGLPELRSFGAERHAAAEIGQGLDRLASSRRRLTELNALGLSAGSLLGDLMLLAVIAAAAGLIGGAGQSAPAFVAVCLIAIAVVEPVVGLSAATNSRAKARAAASRLDEVFGEVGPPPAGMPLPARPWPVKIEIGGRSIAEVRAGDTVILTGPSGTGKSTLLRAISGQPAHGIAVRLGAGKAQTVDPDALTRHVTLVAQDAYVFDGTIRENLQLAAPEAAEAELWEALAAAALDDTVDGFPGGLHTSTGPGGSALSGGQRRRLSVAQGLLRRPAVLLLDEPTEGLDTETASRLLAGVREFDPRAALVIALHDRQSPTLPWAPTARMDLNDVRTVP